MHDWIHGGGVADQRDVDVWVGLYLSGVDVHDIVRAGLHVTVEDVWRALEDNGVVFRWGGRVSEAGELGALAAWAVTYDEHPRPGPFSADWKGPLLYECHQRISRSGLWVYRQGHGGGGSHGTEMHMVDVWSLACDAELDSWTVSGD